MNSTFSQLLTVQQESLVDHSFNIRQALNTTQQFCSTLKNKLYYDRMMTAMKLSEVNE